MISKSLGLGTYKKIIMDKAREKKQIRSATIELLDFCNFSCKHCYVRDTYQKLLSMDKYKYIIDQLRIEGCIWLLLTGGEPFLHPDFCQMYEYAYDKGLQVTVFTNGYLCNSSILNLFSKKKPEEIEISLYGGDEEQFDVYTGVSGSFKGVMNTIDQLIKIGCNVKLKTVVTKELVSSLANMKDIAERKGLKFRQDGHILPKVNSNNEPFEYRVDPLTLVDIDVRDTLYVRKLIEKEKK